MTSDPRTVAFIGASTGVGLSALKHTLAAGLQCIALCRTPSKLSVIFPPETTPNLRIVEGNAHDVGSVSQAIQTTDGRLVNIIVSTIGGKFVPRKMAFDDPEVCQKGTATLLEALAQFRRDGAVGSPHLVVCSTTGISRFGRDISITLLPLYYTLGVPHKDKLVMEDRLVAGGVPFTAVRPSLLVDGESTKPIRVGVEDPKTGRQSEAVGFSISREDTGKWMAEHLVLKTEGLYLNKFVTLTY